MDIKDFYFSYFQAGKISIDSRKIEKGTVFFAFSGENFDAATKAEDAIQNGATAVIVEKKEYENKKVLVGYNGIDGKEVTMSKLKDDINEIRDSKSTFI